MRETKHFLDEKKVYQVKSILSIAICALLTILAANGYNKGWTTKLKFQSNDCLHAWMAKLGLFSDLHAGVLIGKDEIERHVLKQGKCGHYDIVRGYGDGS